jgi:MFS family permease
MRVGLMRRVVLPLIVLTTIQMISTMAYLTVPVMAPALAVDLGIEASRIGIYTSLVFVGATLISLVSGPLMLRYGPMRLCQVGLALAALGLLATLTAWLPVVFLSAIVVGFGYGPATPAGSHILAKVTPAKSRGLVFSIKQSGVPMAGMLVGLIVPIIVVNFGWQTAILAMTLAVLLLAVVIQPLRAKFDYERNPDHAIAVGSLWQSMALVWGHPMLRRLALACFVFSGVQLCLFSFFVVYLLASGGHDLISAGAVYAVMQISGVAARIMWGWIADRLLPARLVLGLIALISAAFILALSALTPEWPPALLLIVAVMLGMTASGWNGVALAEVARIMPDNVANVTSGTAAFTYMGVVVGPAAFSAIVAITDSYQIAFYVLAVLSGLAGLWLLRREKH